MNEPKKLPPIELVEASFDYDPITGDLTRLKTGTVVTVNDRTTGYPKVRVGRVTTSVSRIAWLLFYKEDPVGFSIQHLDGDKHNNRITNLRKVKRPTTKRQSLGNKWN